MPFATNTWDSNCTICCSCASLGGRGICRWSWAASIAWLRSDGSRAGLARIFWLRNVVGALISWIPLAGGLYALVDLLWIFGGARRCVHDYIADTIVVNA